ncbi:DUF4238 domain-containing protein [Sphingomonas oryzagri]
MSFDPLSQQHHYLPQFYQRRWTGDDGKLVVFERPIDRVISKRRFPRETAKEAGLYAIPGAPEPDRNMLEDRLWRTIDQWGADALAILESTDPRNVDRLARDRWAVFLLALIFRDPASIAKINLSARQHYETDFADFAPRYDELRLSHEPETFEDFIAAFDCPGMSEFGGLILRSFALNKAIREQLLSMDWHVVDVANPRVDLMTSDSPVIRFKGLKDPDGLLMLPLGPRRFFVAHNGSPLNMRAEIDRSIVEGHFIESMNKYLVHSAIRFAYGANEEGRPVAEHCLRRPSDPVITRW